MSELALTDDILMQVEKPARYIGNEINSVVKPSFTVDIRMAMCFPDVYEILHRGFLDHTELCSHENKFARFQLFPRF